MHSNWKSRGFTTEKKRILGVKLGVKKELCVSSTAPTREDQARVVLINIESNQKIMGVEHLQSLINCSAYPDEMIMNSDACIVLYKPLYVKFFFKISKERPLRPYKILRLMDTIKTDEEITQDDLDRCFMLSVMPPDIT